MASPCLAERRRAMAAGLGRAADRLDAQARELDGQVARWRKDRSRDDTPTVARTLHDVARQLRGWAADCLFEAHAAGD